MNICVFGMGYVGCVTAACLIKQGHKVIGVDVIQNKVDELNNGNWPIYEPGLRSLNDQDVFEKNFSAITDEIRALNNSELAMICVGTPEMPNGRVNFNYLESVLDEVSGFLKNNSKDYTILIRSTIPPGSTRRLVLNRFNNRESNIQIAFLPEFLREGNAINDFFSPSLKLVGCEDDFHINILENIFHDVKGEWHVTDFETAESIKYISNSWHALKIVFTNEIAMILKEYNLDTEKTMNLFCQDKVLNISEKYMRPGFAYGGSCLPKDLSALKLLAKEVGIKTPLIDSISQSNAELINRLELFITDQKYIDIVFCGISFKPNTDDIRNSPIVIVINNLLTMKRSYQRKLNISIYDSKEALRNFFNQTELKIGTIDDMNKLLIMGDVIVLGPYKISNDLVMRMLKQDKIIIDLKWHILEDDVISHPNYHSLV